MSGRRYLLDSHVLLWLDWGDRRLLPHLETLAAAEKRYFSAASAWELGLKQAAGKLRLDRPIQELLPRFRMEELPVLICHADRAVTLPLVHRDPFDRILIAQAAVEDLILVTADKKIRGYDIPILPI
jgi:PIN domain nuclease of toxin-antitoxin system